MDDLLAELEIMQEYEIVTTLLCLQFSSPISALQKSNGKLRILVYTCRRNYLIEHEYRENNHPVTTSSDVTQHLPGKRYFWTITARRRTTSFIWSMNSPLNSSLLTFDSLTFVYKRLAQGFNKSRPAFTCMLTVYIDPAVRVYRCAQYVDVNETVAGTSLELTKTLYNVFQQIQKAGFKNCTKNFQFDQQTIELLDKASSWAIFALFDGKTTNFWKAL